MRIKKVLAVFLMCIFLGISLCFADIYLMQNNEINGLIEENHQLSHQLEVLKEPKDGVLYHGQLKVEGTDLVDCNGEKFQLRGISSHGILWYPEYSNYRAIRTTKQFGANVFRIAMYTEPSKGYVNLPKESIDAVIMAVENTLGADMYAIVDWHILKDGNPNTYVEKAIEFFDKISALYGDNPAIIYEICNEPNGDTSWEDIVEYSNKVIPVIRKNAPDALIIVGTPKYCTNLQGAVQNPLSFENVLYSFHYYTELGQENYVNTLSGAINRIPLFVSEWGISDHPEGLTLASGFVDYLNQNNISWVNWSLSNKEENYSLLRPDCKHFSNWTEECLTKTGKFIFERLKSY